MWLLLHQKMQTDVLDFFNVAQLLTREEEKNTRKGQMVDNDKREMSSEKEIKEILPSNQLYDHCRETYKYCKCITYVKMCFEIGGFQTINNVLSFGKDL